MHTLYLTTEPSEKTENQPCVPALLTYGHEAVTPDLGMGAAHAVGTGGTQGGLQVVLELQLLTPGVRSWILVSHLDSQTSLRMPSSWASSLSTGEWMSMMEMAVMGKRCWHCC